MKKSKTVWMAALAGVFGVLGQVGVIEPEVANSIAVVAAALSQVFQRRAIEKLDKKGE